MRFFRALSFWMVISLCASHDVSAAPFELIAPTAITVYTEGGLGIFSAGLAGHMIALDPFPFERLDDTYSGVPVQGAVASEVGPEVSLHLLVHPEGTFVPVIANPVLDALLRPGELTVASQSLRYFGGVHWGALGRGYTGNHTFGVALAIGEDVASYSVAVTFINEAHADSYVITEAARVPSVVYEPSTLLMLTLGVIAMVILQVNVRPKRPFVFTTLKEM